MMGRCTTCGTGFVTVGGHVSPDHECHWCEIKRLRKERDELREKLAQITSTHDCGLSAAISPRPATLTHNTPRLSRTCQARDAEDRPGGGGAPR